MKKHSSGSWLLLGCYYLISISLLFSASAGSRPSYPPVTIFLQSQPELWYENIYASGYAFGIPGFRDETSVYAKVTVASGGTDYYIFSNSENRIGTYLIRSDGFHLSEDPFCTRVETEGDLDTDELEFFPNQWGSRHLGNNFFIDGVNMSSTSDSSASGTYTSGGDTYYQTAVLSDPITLNEVKDEVYALPLSFSGSFKPSNFSENSPGASWNVGNLGFAIGKSSYYFSNNQNQESNILWSIWFYQDSQEPIVRLMHWSGTGSSPAFELNPELLEGEVEGSYGIVVHSINGLPERIPVNSNFDEQKIDAETGYAIPDSMDDDLLCVSGSNAGKICPPSYLIAFPGVYLPDRVYEGGTITIKKKSVIDEVTGKPQSGTVRFYAIKNLGQEGEQFFPIPISAGTNSSICSGSPRNLVGVLYGTETTIPKSSGTSSVQIYAEGVTPGPLTLEYSLSIGDVSLTKEMKVMVATYKDKSGWQEEIRQKVLLETSGNVDLKEYDFNRSFSANRETLLAVYSFYEFLFKEKPDVFLWAGLAKMAGAPVYGGINDCEWAIVDGSWMLFFLKLLPGNQITEPLTHGVKGSARFYQTCLTMGNKEIFSDLAWQFYCYQASGIWALDYINRSRDTLAPGDVRFDIEPWDLLFEAENEDDSTQLEGAALAFVDREQMHVIQPTFNKIRLSATWPWSPTGMLSSILSKNPLPGGASFSQTVPGGDVTLADDRWDWITNLDSGTPDGIFVIWTTYDGVEREQLVDIDLRERVKNYSIPYQMNSTKWPIW